MVVRRGLMFCESWKDELSRAAAKSEIGEREGPSPGLLDFNSGTIFPTFQTLVRRVMGFGTRFFSNIGASPLAP